MADVHVLNLRPNSNEAVKPSELIQISGHQTLSLNARRAITILWHNAHKQGIQEGRDYSIELSELRTDGHKGTERTEEAVLMLMQTVLTVKLSDGRVRRVQFLGGNDMDDPHRPAGLLTYSFDKRLVEILRDSKIWGRIAIPVLMAFSSKYTVSLYENACQWANLTKKVYQDFTLEEMRDLLGIEAGKYSAFGDLNKHVLKPSVDEINALAPFNVSIYPRKTGKRVTHIRIGWWQKSVDEMKEAWRESERPRVGRRARITGKVASVSEPISSDSLIRKKEKRLRLSEDVIDPDSS